MPANLGIARNDQAFGFGTSQFTINGSTFYIENASWTKNANVVDVPNEVGAPRGQIIVEGKIEGTMTLQYSNSASYIPTTGDVFLLPAGQTPAQTNHTASGITMSFTTVTTPRNMGQYWTMEVGAVQLLNY